MNPCYQAVDRRSGIRSVISPGPGDYCGSADRRTAGWNWSPGSPKKLLYRPDHVTRVGEGGLVAGADQLDYLRIV